MRHDMSNETKTGAVEVVSPTLPNIPPRARVEPDLTPDLAEVHKPGIRAQRLLRIAQLISSGLWNTGQAMDLADEWKYSPATIKQLASYASDFLEITINDKAQLQRLCQSRLVQIAQEDDNDRVPALGLVMKAAGLLDAKGGGKDEPKPPAKLWEAVDLLLESPDEETLQHLHAKGWHRDPNWRADVVETTGESE